MCLQGRIIADALSRLTKTPASDQSLQVDEYVRMVALHATPTALRIKEIERISAQDSELQEVCVPTMVQTSYPGSYKSI